MVFRPRGRYTEGIQIKQGGPIMTLDIGAKIRQYRLSKNLTQEALARSLGLSSQAVSKWENGTTMPDIQLLPELSVALGVSIDELFSMTDAHRLARIENMLDNVRYLPQREFEDAERYLKSLLHGLPGHAGATLLLAQLYNKRADEYRALAQPLAREALRLNPGSKGAHNTVFDAENGPYQDWNLINHRGLIDFYKSVTAAHPEDRRNYYWLLDALIADCRTAEAREYVQKLRAVADTYHCEMYMGHICRAEGDLAAAEEWWKKMTDKAPEAWIVWAEYASCLARLGRYGEALRYYRKAMPMRPAPRYIDCEEAVAQISEILGDYPAAVAALEQALDITRSDWTSEGECVDRLKREIARLREKI